MAAFFMALAVCGGLAQTQSLPNDLIPIDPSTIAPRSVCAWWSIAHYGQWPPCPDNCGDPGDALYYSMSIGPSEIFIDDRSSSQQATRSPAMDDSSDDSTNAFGGGGEPLLVFSTNLCLYLSHPFTNGSNWEATLTLSNTVTASPYEVIASPVVTNALSNWLSMGIWIGDSGNTTPISVILSTNVEYFFDARLWALGRFPNGSSVPTNGQILLELTGTNRIQATVNGVFTNLSPFWSNYVVLDPPIYSLDFGYDASDSGPATNSTTYLSLTNQGIRGVVGFSSTLTNLCLSYNPLTSLDVHGFTALQDLECWQCADLVSANITNCLALLRVCLESCNLTGTLNLSGDTNLQQLRAASQGSLGTGHSLLQNIVFGGAGPNIWHLCAHDNAFTNNFNFAQFPSLREFWFLRANQSGSLAVNSTSLTSVQLYQNNFTSADFHNQVNLTNVEIDYNSNLTSLNVAGCTGLTNRLTATFDDLPTSALDSVLASLDATGSKNGFVALYGANNGTLSEVGLTAMMHLTNAVTRNWYVGWNPAPVGTPVISDVSDLPSSNAATVTWTTDIASDSRVYYGLTTNYGFSGTNALSTTNHSVTMTGLTPNALYHFYVTSTTGTNTGTTWDYELTTLYIRAS